MKKFIALVVMFCAVMISSTASAETVRIADIGAEDFYKAMVSYSIKNQHIPGNVKLTFGPLLRDTSLDLPDKKMYVWKTSYLHNNEYLGMILIMVDEKGYVDSFALGYKPEMFTQWRANEMGTIIEIITSVLGLNKEETSIWISSREIPHTIWIPRKARRFIYDISKENFVIYFFAADR